MNIMITALMVLVCAIMVLGWVLIGIALVASLLAGMALVASPLAVVPRCAIAQWTFSRYYVAGRPHAMPGQ